MLKLNLGDQLSAIFCIEPIVRQISNIT